MAGETNEDKAHEAIKKRMDFYDRQPKRIRDFVKEHGYYPWQYEKIHDRSLRLIGEMTTKMTSLTLSASKVKVGTSPRIIYTEDGESLSLVRVHHPLRGHAVGHPSPVAITYPPRLSSNTRPGLSALASVLRSGTSVVLDTRSILEVDGTLRRVHPETQSMEARGAERQAKALRHPLSQM